MGEHQSLLSALTRQPRPRRVPEGLAQPLDGRGLLALLPLLLESRLAEALVQRVAGAVVALQQLQHLALHARELLLLAGTAALLAAHGRRRPRGLQLVQFTRRRPIRARLGASEPQDLRHVAHLDRVFLALSTAQLICILRLDWLKK